MAKAAVIDGIIRRPDATFTQAAHVVGGEPYGTNDPVTVTVIPRELIDET